MSGKFPTNQRLLNALMRPLSEKVMDPELRHAREFAKQHYQDFDDKEAFDKFVVRSLRHAKDDDTRQNHQLADLKKELDELKAHLASLQQQDVSEGTLTELISYSSDKNYSDAGAYKRYNLYIGKKKFNNLYFVAIAENPRTLEAKFKAKGNTPQEALDNLRAEIDKEIDVATKVSGQATLDFNVDFVRDILEMSADPFYAKIIPGPKLVLAGSEMMEYPEILQDEGFKVSSIRTYRGGEGTTKLPGVPLSPRAAVAANLIANGRYVLGAETTDKDGNKVFDLEFDSVVQSPTEKMRMRAPAFTVGTVREKGVAEGNYEYQPPGASRAQTSQVLSKMKPASKFVWKKPNQIGGSFSEQELLAKGFKKSQYNSWGGTESMWQKLVTRECAGSGVIASKKQAKDPRYSMSLTKDVRPGQIAKNLKAFSLEESKKLSPDLYEEIDPGFIARIAKGVVPDGTVKIHSDEGFAEINTQDGLHLLISASIAEGGYSINLSGGTAAATGGEVPGRITAIIKEVVDGITNKFGVPSQQTELTIDDDRGHGVWQHIAQKLGLSYGAHRVAEGEADYGPEYQAMVKRVGQRAKQGPMKTVWDEKTRRYKVVPVNPPKEQGVAEDELAEFKSTGFNGLPEGPKPDKNGYYHYILFYMWPGPAHNPQSVSTGSKAVRSKKLAPENPEEAAVFFKRALGGAKYASHELRNDYKDRMQDIFRPRPGDEAGVMEDQGAAEGWKDDVETAMANAIARLIESQLK